MNAPRCLLWLVVASLSSLDCQPARQKVTVEAAPGSITKVVVPSGALKLEATLVRPSGAGPFPAIVYNHGSEDQPSFEHRRLVGEFFQSHGFVALFPHRRGASGSEGVHWEKRVEGLRAEERNAHIVKLIDEENDDVIAAIEWLRKLPDVDPSRVAVAGCSFGGIHSLIAAERSPHIYAALDFAGGAMSWAKSTVLQERMRHAATHAQVPLFFLQAENDFDTTPSRVLSAAMTQAGKSAKMKIYPPHGETPRDGHHGFCSMAIDAWGGDVLAFLRAPSGALVSGAH